MWIRGILKYLDLSKPAVGGFNRVGRGDHQSGSARSMSMSTATPASTTSTSSHYESGCSCEISCGATVGVNLPSIRGSRHRVDLCSVSEELVRRCGYFQRLHVVLKDPASSASPSISSIARTNPRLMEGDDIDKFCQLDRSVRASGSIPGHAPQAP